MIRHIVFFTTPAATRAEALAGLKSLEGNPAATLCEVRENLRQDGVDDGVDLVVYAEFTDAAALAAFKAHPIYTAATARVKPLREMRLVADIAV